LTVCPFSAAGVAFGFLTYPRPYARPKRCRCIRCDYDIRESIAAGRCPECGHVLIAGVDYPLPKAPAVASAPLPHPPLPPLPPIEPASESRSSV
jgi:hypothetical protein